MESDGFTFGEIQGGGFGGAKPPRYAGGFGRAQGPQIIG